MASQIPAEVVQEIMFCIEDIDTRRSLHHAWKSIFDIPYERPLSCRRRSSFEDIFSSTPKVEFIQDVDFPAGSPWHQPDSYEVFLEGKGFMYTIEYSEGDRERIHHINGTRFCRNGAAHDTSYTLSLSENVWRSDYLAPECEPGCQELRRVR